ncbi:hypothetical protein N7492_004500 [Penicillium capsulatum]|uniref:Ribosome quality control complex subunit 2 n=1 Tax=Penicillium capsulatum TaxID=69766 RepID=A0A9W9IBN9_9EURO|nr:hypothetical protein N7492_004500 [Penicillium capsulatum]KAJ6136379.1 hypothetical protein N7512_001539 [Penicillium capsulatum]
MEPDSVPAPHTSRSKIPFLRNTTGYDEAEILLARRQGITIDNLRFSANAHGSQVITQELASELVSLRVSNIYDLSSRIFLFKLAKPDHRRQLIVDSGFRAHVTQYSRTAATAPSSFVTRLRKLLKSRRVTSVSQVGTDRVIDISFSDGAYHMFLEFFAGGNIIVTDHEHTIIALFRQVSMAEGEETKLGLKYNITSKQNCGGVPDITPERIKQTLEKAQAIFSKEDAPQKKGKKGKDILRKALTQGFPEYPPLLLDHAFAVKEFDASIPLDQILGNEKSLQIIGEVLEEAQRVSNSYNVGASHAGYIIAKQDPRAQAEGQAENERSKSNGLLYEDFHPFRPRQFEGKDNLKILEFERFNATVDEYFSSVESQRLESRLTEREETAKRKLESVRDEHKKRIDALKDVQELHIRKAGAIEDNMYRVQEAMDAVNGLIAQGMDWGEIARLIEMEQSRGNPVAQIIKLPLKLYENTITLMLSEGDEDEDEEIDSSEDEDSESESEAKENQQRADAASKILSIDIDLGLTPWANATQLYEQKKQASEKEQRTADSSTKALKSHEKKVTADLKKGLKQEKQVLRQARDPFWFEKFIFFISSEGYLVIGARDAMQSELLYRRYLKKGDIFVHADLEGALPIVVKNRPGVTDAPISPSTLSQAGNLSVATSTAWDSKAVMSAWWVQASQVSKTAQTGGGILPTGSFEVKGEKNFLAPSQLVLGFAVLFQISKESIKNHKQRFEGDAVVPELPKQEPREEPSQSAPLEPQAPEENEKANEPDNVSEGEEEEANEDETPARNPLQRGDSELPARQEQETLASEPESEAEEETREEPQLEETAAHAEHQEEDAPVEKDVASAPAQNTTPPKEEERLSARERRTLRQGNALDRPVPPEPPRSAPTRGKRAKEKRAAAKYAQQDDEERELALRLLGAGKGKAAKAAQAAEAKAQREREAEAQRQRRRAQHERAAAAEQKRQALFAENGTDDYNEETAAAEAADMSWIPALVGTPSPDDEILAAIAVCAPWGALGRYKYKVKLQPGTVKKGKAVKEIVGRWVSETTTGKVKKEHAEDAGIPRVDAERLRAREGDLLKGWKDTEIINSMPVGKVRIMTSGSGGGNAGGDKGKSKGGAKGGKGGKKK